MSSPNLAELKENELRVVAIGGGTGLSTLLRGLKRYVVMPERRRGTRMAGAQEAQRPPVLPSPALRCVIRELSAGGTVTGGGGPAGRPGEDFKKLPPGGL